MDPAGELGSVDLNVDDEHWCMNAVVGSIYLQKHLSTSQEIQLQGIRALVVQG